MAEGVFRAAVNDLCAADEWLVDSAGIQAGFGHPPEPNAVTVAAHYGADISTLRSRPFEAADFAGFDIIIAMDLGHLDLLNAICPETFTGTISLLPSVGSTEFIEVPDPYGGARRGYEKAGKLIVDGTGELLERLKG